LPPLEILLFLQNDAKHSIVLHQCHHMPHDDLPSLEDVIAKSFKEMKEGPSEPVPEKTEVSEPQSTSAGTYQAPIHATVETASFSMPAPSERPPPTMNDTTHVVASASSQIGDDFDVAWGEEE
jgi:hypothetical protein